MAADFTGSLFTNCVQIHRSPSAKWPPSWRHVGHRVARAVLFCDFGLEASFVPGRHIGCIGATNHHEFYAKRADTFLYLAQSARSRRVRPTAASVRPAEPPWRPRRRCADIRSCGPADRGQAGAAPLGREMRRRPHGGEPARRAHARPARCAARWDNTDHAAASYGEWKPHGRRPARLRHCRWRGSVNGQGLPLGLVTGVRVLSPNRCLHWMIGASRNRRSARRAQISCSQPVGAAHLCAPRARHLRARRRRTR